MPMLDAGGESSPPAPFTHTLSRRRLLGGAAALAAAPLFARVEPIAALVAAHGPATGYHADVPLAWGRLLLDCIRDTPGYSPPVAARAIAYLGVGCYQAVVGGMPSHRSLDEVLGVPQIAPPHRGTGACHWPTAANAAMAELMRQLFPTAPAARRAEIDRLEGQLLGGPRSLRHRSVDHGRRVAATLASWAADDGGDAAYLRNFPADYVPPTGPGFWESTPPAFLPALQPRWGSNRCFAIRSGGSCDPGPPPAYSIAADSAFMAEGLEVHAKVRSLSADELEIARYWSDDPVTTATPPGHSLSILLQVLEADGASLSLAAESFARLGMAVSDAFVACWNVKYRVNLLRPITYVRANIDPTWGDPLPLVTPPFPEYPSGHSVQSAAAATVMTAIFGSRSFTDRTHESRGLTARTFPSFQAAAVEAAISRLYGGIHFRSGIERGLEQGRCVGQAAATLALVR